MKSEAVKCLCGFLAIALLTVSSSAAAGTPCRATSVALSTLQGGGSEVSVRTGCEADYTARVERQGKRIVVDLRNVIVDGAAAALTERKGVVAGVLTQTFKADGVHTARVLLQLAEPASYEMVSAEGRLRILLKPADKTHAAPLADRPGTHDEEEAAPSDRHVALRDLRFEHGKVNDRVIIELSGNAGHSESRLSATRSLLLLDDATLPSALQRKLDVSAFGGSVRAVSTYVSSDGKVTIDVDHADDVSGVVVRYGSALHYVFSDKPAHSTHTGVGPDGRAARTTQTVASEVEQWESEPDRAGAFLPARAPMQTRQRQRFTGRRIDLDLKDADIHNVLRFVADVGRVNIVSADNVSGTVTIRMRNVPWDQALDTVLQAKALGMVRKGNIIRVALMSDLNHERELAIARRRAELALEPLETRLIPVSYATAADLQARAREMLSPRGSIAVDERTNVLIARDVRGNLNQVEELVRALDTQTPQVLIEARIVEATSSFRRDVGIQWGGDVQFGPATGNDTGLVFPSRIGVVGGGSDQETPTAGLSPTAATVPNPNFAINLPATVGTGAGGALGLTLGSIDNTVNLAVRLSAAEATGMLRIVSSPRILTLDNHDARINQGTLIPFSQISAQGVQTVFQEAKLQLLVRPHVTADGSVSMHVKINRDEPDFNQTSARGDPTILKREAETDLLVRDGHTAVIGGIYTRNTGRNLDQVPILGDIPVLGVLFQRRRSSDTRSELVIFITPRIVNRAEALGR